MKHQSTGLIEKVILDRTGTFLSSRNLIYIYRSAFRKNHSIGVFLSFLNDKDLKDFGQCLLTGMILIDLRKAFDTIDHDILLQKLYGIGFSKHSVNSFQSCVIKRIFLVKLGDVFSHLACVSIGVPQGSVLAPLLFLIFINDMSPVAKCNLFLYADNTCFIIQHKDVNGIRKQLNEDFENIGDWFDDNKVSIHFDDDEIKSILFPSKFKIKKIRKLHVRYGDIQIKQHFKVKYFGCMLDETMMKQWYFLYFLLNQ